MDFGAEGADFFLDLFLDFGAEGAGFFLDLFLDFGAESADFFGFFLTWGPKTLKFHAFFGFRRHFGGQIFFLIFLDFAKP